MNLPWRSRAATLERRKKEMAMTAKKRSSTKYRCQGTAGLTMPVDFMPELPKLRRSGDDLARTLEEK